MVDAISRLLTEDCVITFTNGTVIKGSKEVAEVISRCCEEYNAGFMEGAIKTIAKGAVIGVLAVGTGIIVSKTIKSKMKSKKETISTKEEA